MATNPYQSPEERGATGNLLRNRLLTVAHSIALAVAATWCALAVLASQGVVEWSVAKRGISGGVMGALAGVVIAGSGVFLYRTYSVRRNK